MYSTGDFFVVVNHSYHIGFEFYVCFFRLQKDFISSSIRVVNQCDVMYIRECNRAQKASNSQQLRYQLPII